MVSVSGLVSGIDTKAIINAFVSAKRRPIQNMLRTKSGIQTQLSKIGTISSKLSDVKSYANGMKTVGDVLAYTATSSSETVATVTSNGSASPGSYAVEVTTLSQKEKDRSAAIAGGAFAEVKAGTITIELDSGKSKAITVNEGDTLTDVKNAINAAGLAVDASIIDDGTNAYLQIVAREGGHKIGGAPSDAIQITEAYTGASGAELGMTEITAAQNTNFTLDGIAIEKRQDTIGDVLEGVTFTLLKAGTTTVEIDQDATGTKENVQGFLDAINEVLSLVVDELRVTANTNPLTSLSGDFTIRKLQTDLMELVTTAVPGLGSSFDSLTTIGIETGADGLLKIDSTVFDKRLAADIMTIGEMFSKATDGIADKTIALVTNYTDSSKGYLTNREDSLNDRIDDIDDQVIKMEDRVAQLEKTLVGQFTAMETAMSRIKTQGGALTSFLGQQEKSG